MLEVLLVVEVDVLFCCKTLVLGVAVVEATPAVFAAHTAAVVGVKKALKAVQEANEPVVIDTLLNGIPTSFETSLTILSKISLPCSALSSVILVTNTLPLLSFYLNVTFG